MPTKNCERCHESCRGCSGPNENQCIYCNPGVTFDPLTGTCKCTIVGQSMVNGYCESCHNTCLGCSGPLPIDCTSCTAPQALSPLDNTCSESCPLRNYNELGICVDCHESCLKCSGTTANHCLHCLYYDSFLNEDLKCIPCDTEEALTLDQCRYVKKLNLKEEKTAPNIYSSNTVEVYFERQSEHAQFLKTLTDSSINSYLKVNSFTI